MNFRKQHWLSWLLVLSFLLQPFVPVLAANNAKDQTSRSSSIDDAVAQINEVYDLVMNIEPIDIGAFGSACVGAGNFFDNVGTWWHNVGDFWFNDSNDQKTYSDYNGDIQKANAEIAAAKERAASMKKAAENNNFNAVKDFDPNKMKDEALSAAFQAQATARRSLNSAGEALVSASETIDSILSIVGTVVTILKAVVLVFAPAAVALEGILATIDTVIEALSPVVTVIGETGEGLIQCANAGQMSDAAIFTATTNHVAAGLATDYVMDKAMDWGGEQIGSLCESIAKKKPGMELITSSIWDGKGTWANYQTSQTFKDFPSLLDTKENREIITNFNKEMFDMGTKAMGVEMPNLKGHIEDKADELSESITEGVTEIDFKTISENPGLAFE